MTMKDALAKLGKYVTIVTVQHYQREGFAMDFKRYNGKDCRKEGATRRRAALFTGKAGLCLAMLAAAMLIASCGSSSGSGGGAENASGNTGETLESTANETLPDGAGAAQDETRAVADSAGSNAAAGSDGTEPSLSHAEAIKAGKWLVHFDPNGGTGSMGDQTVEYKTPSRLHANAFQREGYVFKNWNTKPDGTGTAYADTAELSELKSGSPARLYAQWAKEALDASTGKAWNSTLKQLSGQSGASHDSINTSIRAIQKADALKEGALPLVGTLTDGDPYLWFEDGTIYYYLKKGKLVLNEDGMGLFMNLANLEDISGLADWDISHVNSLHMAFYGCGSLEDLTALEKWDTGNVTSLYALFYGCENLLSLEGLEKWNVSKVTNMYTAFYNCVLLDSLSPLEKWNVSALTNLQSCFSNCKALESLDGLEKWNVSKLNLLDSTFDGCSSLTDISALKNWNTSQVSNMQKAFYGCTELSDLTGIKDLNTSNVTSLLGMFAYCGNLTDARVLSSHLVEDRTPAYTAWSVNHVNVVNGVFTGTGISNGTVPDWYESLRSIDQIPVREKAQAASSSGEVPGELEILDGEGNGPAFDPEVVTLPSDGTSTSAGTARTGGNGNPLAPTGTPGSGAGAAGLPGNAVGAEGQAAANGESDSPDSALSADANAGSATTNRGDAENASIEGSAGATGPGAAAGAANAADASAGAAETPAETGMTEIGAEGNASSGNNGVAAQESGQEADSQGNQETAADATSENAANAATATAGADGSGDAAGTENITEGNAESAPTESASIAIEETQAETSETVFSEIG